jgi:glyoxylase-like metal-dependent hydrolase (beta-lactamase superfamily II)
VSHGLRIGAVITTPLAAMAMSLTNITCDWCQSVLLKVISVAVDCVTYGGCLWNGTYLNLLEKLEVVMKSSRSVTVLLVLLVGLTLPVSLLAAVQQPAPVQVESQQVADKIYVLTDSGGMGNSAILTGDDGVLLIDAKIKESVDLLLAKVAHLSGKPIRFEVVTHWHFDHVGGNEKVAGAGALIVAHDNVRKQMGISHDMKLLGSQVPPSPPAALPLLTYQTALHFYMDGEDVEVFHPGAGHTDGDSVVFFRKENVIHMGDLYFNGLYPFIGIYSGGSPSFSYTP